MTKLTILRGISGSGKSTWARQQNAVVVSRDSIRDMLFETHKRDPRDYYQQGKGALSACESSVTIVQDSTIGGLLRAGIDVIVDNTNIEFKFVKALAKIGHRYGADVEVKVFDVDLATATMRDLNRKAAGGRYVGSVVISKQYEHFKSNKSMTLDPVYVPKPYNGTSGKEQAFMVDIDGTLADHTGLRSPYGLNVGEDRPRQVVIDMVRALAQHYIVIVMSGRKTATRRDTVKWLIDNDLGWYDELFMRADDDNRADNLVKADLFDAHVRDNYDVKFVLDDRDQVVEMWRRMGLDCFQVQPGDF